MNVKIKGKTYGKIHSLRLDYQRKWKKTFDINQTIEMLINEVEK